ncbi:hypothetical protein D3C75_833170 [compost metagenome]
MVETFGACLAPAIFTAPWLALATWSRISVSCLSMNACISPPPCSMESNMRSYIAVSTGLFTTSGKASIMLRPSSVLTRALPLSARKLRRFNSSMIEARVAEVPMPSPSRSIFLCSLSSTYLWMFSIAWVKEPSVNRAGGLVLESRRIALRQAV